MPELISQKERKARKPHTCDYCGETINSGETYNHAVLRLDDIYTWDSHLRCIFIATALWDFVDPDNGMTSEDFHEACSEFCKRFICPDCTSWDHDSEECRNGPSSCVQKIYDFLQTHDFKRVKDEHGWMHVWKCTPKEAVLSEVQHDQAQD